nr:hypothetical protein [Corallococcus coralloides]
MSWACSSRLSAVRYSSPAPLAVFSVRMPVPWSGEGSASALTGWL